MNYQQPSIYLFDIRIDEPVVTLTDLLLAFVCLYAYRRLKKQDSQNQAFIQIRMFFLLIGLSTILGGIFGHGFLYYFNQTWQHPDWLQNFIDSIPFLIAFKPFYFFRLPGWLLGIFAIYMFEQGMVHWFSNQLKPRTTRFLLSLNIVEVILVTSFVLLTFNFLYVVLHIIYGLLLVVCTLHIYLFFKYKYASSLYMIGAVLAMIVAGIVHATKLGLSEWFTHHDVNHTIMALSIFIFLLGVEKLLNENKEKAQHTI